MPCYDPQADEDRDRTCRIACEAMGLLEKALKAQTKFVVSAEAWEWWTQHKEWDQWRKERGL